MTCSADAHPRGVFAATRPVSMQPLAHKSPNNALILHFELFLRSPQNRDHLRSRLDRFNY